VLPSLLTLLRRFSPQPLRLSEQQGEGMSHSLAALFFVVSVVFVYRSFYGMRIGKAAH
jgi:hypothetical protein